MEGHRARRAAWCIVTVPTEARWHITNLPYSATEHDVEQLFADLGRVGRVHLVTDRESGRPRGFGFVTILLHSDPHASLLSAYGRRLRGRALRVSVAHPDTRHAA